MRPNTMAVVAGTFALALGMATASPVDAQTTFKLDPTHSFIVCQVGHLDLGKAWGMFVGPTGTVLIDDANPTKSSIQIEVRADSFNTGTPARDTRVKSPDMFDAKQFPVISFKSTAVKKTAENTYEVSGDFTMHGVTKPLTVTLTKLGEHDTVAPFGYRAVYETNFTIKRSDFGMTTMLQIVSDEVKLFVDVEGTR